MFGENVLEQVGQIAEGWTNDFLGKEQELSDMRMKICRKCPLYDEEKDRCSSKRCYNKETGELSTAPEKGFICGCGCFISKKSRVRNAKCVLGYWDSIK